MAGITCNCGDDKFANMGLPNCVIQMRPIAFPIIMPRYKADGTRNTLDPTSATVGSTINALITTATAAVERLYPWQELQNPVWTRSDTEYKTYDNGEKSRIYGKGGVYNLAAMQVDAAAAFQLAREAQKMGCTEFDMWIAAIDGSVWGVMDDPLNSPTEMHGYAVNASTVDSFMKMPDHNEGAELMYSWDFDRFECFENSYVITKETLLATGGVASTDLRGNQSGVQVNVTPLTNTTVQVTLQTGFGPASEFNIIAGLVVSDFTVENTDIPAGDTAVSLVESPLGTYVITTSAMTAAENYKITASKQLFDISDGTFVAV